MGNPNDSALLARLEKLEDFIRSNFLRNSSLERGRMRFHSDSELLVEDSNLTVTGEATVWGALRAIGRITLEALGVMTIRGMVELFGALRIKAGGYLDVEDGEIRAAGVRIAEGKIFVGSGSSQVVIDGATGKIVAGGATIDPATEGGAVTFANGTRVVADGDGVRLGNPGSGTYVRAGDVVEMAKGATRVRIDGVDVEVAAPGGDITLNGNVFLTGLSTIPKSASGGREIGDVFYASGELVRVVLG